MRVYKGDECGWKKWIYMKEVYDKKKVDKRNKEEKYR